MSVASRTTVGGCSFDMLCDGTAQKYACDNVIDITRREDGSTPTLSQAVEMLKTHIENCIQSIETGRGRKVEQFYIGKTHAHKRRRTTFDPMRSATWRLSDGIGQRFRRHRDGGYGRDGLVVLTVVTKKAIPPTLRQNRIKVKQELYAFALENRLIQHFLIEDDDPRVVNKTLNSGGSDGNGSIGYPLYMAFKVEDREDSEADDVSDDSDSVVVVDIQLPPSPHVQYVQVD